MKTFLFFLIAAIATQSAIADNFVFKSNEKEIVIPINSVEWLSKKPEIVELGTASGVFEIKNGKCLFIEFGEQFGIEGDEIFFKTLLRKKEFGATIPNFDHRNVLQELIKLEKEKDKWHERALRPYVISLISDAGIQSDFSCESIVFKPHNH